MRPLAVLRPEPGASATVGRARALGFAAFAMPLFVVEPLAWDVPEPAGFDALLLTSANAVRHGGEQLPGLRSLPVHAVGAATAAAAHAAGLVVAGVGEAGVEQLLATLPPSLRLLHICGENRMPNAGPQSITQVPVYRSAEVDRIADLDRLGGSVALVHSPRAGRRLAELMERRAAVAVAAISPAAATACGNGWAAVEASSQPTDAALLSLAARLCQQPDPK